MGLFFRIWVRLFSRRRSNAVVPEPVIPVVRRRLEPSIFFEPSAAPPQAETELRGPCWVIDGDTIEINSVRIRLAGIDAPELDHPWGKRTKWALVQLCKGQTVTAGIKPELSYDRVVAECFLDDGRDLAAELVRCGLALDWAKFSGGKYRHLEPSGVRRKLWRAHARQRGALAPSPIVRAEPSRQARDFPQAGN